MNQAQIVYLSHGGGPMPLLNDPSHDAMIRFMKELSGSLRKPEAILVFSAHWEEPQVTLLNAPAPGIYYDYYGFPEETYRIRYPAPGNPGLADRVSRLLNAAGIPCRMESERGYDHGVFIPLMMICPDADIPVLQISLLHSLNAEEHLQLGRSLSPLLSENILVIGSGFSYHNMRGFNMSGRFQKDPENDRFQEWLIDTCTRRTPEESQKLLAGWDQAPGARYCHPREEHLLPLHLCAGMAGKKAKLIFDEPVAGKRSVAFLWE